MKKIIGILLLIMMIGCAKQPMLGESCGTVTPGYNDECCANKMKDAVHAMCVGEWKYNFETAQCEWKCETQITNFEECVEAGNPVMESYPRQCNANGQTFTEVINEQVQDNEQIQETQLIGGQRDDNGCLGPAGYSWNQEIGACARQWELNEDTIKAAKIAVEKTGQEYGLTVFEVIVLRCPGCYTVKMSNAEYEQFEVEIVNWEAK